MTDGLAVWMARRSGIPCPTASGIRLLAGTVSDNLWRRFCLQRTDVPAPLKLRPYGAIQIWWWWLLLLLWYIQRIRGFTTMRYTNWLFTYLLTYSAVQAMCMQTNIRYIIFIQRNSSKIKWEIQWGQESGNFANTTHIRYYVGLTINLTKRRLSNVECWISQI